MTRELSRLAKVAAALVLAVALGSGCGRELAPVVPPGDDPVVVRSADGWLSVHWAGAPTGERVEVFWGAAPTAARQHALGVLEGGRLASRDLPASVRPYFALVPERGSPVVVAERRLPLEGAHNFRDLGGYRGAGGRTVRWGQLYRSGDLADLTDDDLAYLDGLGIRLVCDFRSDAERLDSPDRLGAEGVPPRVDLPVEDELFAPADLRARLLRGDLEGLDFETMLVAGNRAFALDFGREYRAFMDRVRVADNRPVVFHCTAGKDRAGFAAAVVLLALGVAEDDVMRDYLLTAAYTRDYNERILRTLRFASLFRTDPGRVRPLLEVRRAYLQGGLDAIDERYGGVDRYLDEALGLNASARVGLQDALLE